MRHTVFTSDVNFIFATINPYDGLHNRAKKTLNHLGETKPEFKMMSSSEKIFINTFTLSLFRAFALIKNAVNESHLKSCENPYSFIERVKTNIDNHLRQKKFNASRNQVDFILSMYSVFDFLNKEKSQEVYRFCQENTKLAKNKLEYFKSSIASFVKSYNPQYNLKSYNKALNKIKNKLMKLDNKPRVLLDKNDDFQIVSELLTWCDIYNKRNKYTLITSDRPLEEGLKILKHKIPHSATSLRFDLTPP